MSSLEQRIPRFLLVCMGAVFLAFCCVGVDAIPQLVLKNGGNKCFKVDVTAEMVLLVKYSAPDLRANSDEQDEEARRRAMTGSDGNEGGEPKDRYNTIYHQDNEKFHRPVKVCLLFRLRFDDGRFGRVIILVRRIGFLTVLVLFFLTCPRKVACLTC